MLTHATSVVAIERHDTKVAIVASPTIPEPNLYYHPPIVYTPGIRRRGPLESTLEGVMALYPEGAWCFPGVASSAFVGKPRPFPVSMQLLLFKMAHSGFSGSMSYYHNPTSTVGLSSSSSSTTASFVAEFQTTEKALTFPGIYGKQSGASRIDGCSIMRLLPESMDHLVTRLFRISCLF